MCRASRRSPSSAAIPRSSRFSRRCSARRRLPDAVTSVASRFPPISRAPRRRIRTTFYTRRSTSLWTVWIPLGECPSTLGGLAVLPGSHAGGLRAHDGGEGEARFIVLPENTLWAGSSYRVGDVLLFNAVTVHGARPNVTADRIRISADFRYQPLVAPSNA